MGDPWSEEDVATALELYNMGWRINAIAKYISRSPRAVCYKLSKTSRTECHATVQGGDGDDDRDEEEDDDDKESEGSNSVIDLDRNLDLDLDLDVDLDGNEIMSAVSPHSYPYRSRVCEYFLMGITTGVVVSCGMAVYVNLFLSNLETMI